MIVHPENFKKRIQVDRYEDFRTEFKSRTFLRNKLIDSKVPLELLIACARLNLMFDDDSTIFFSDDIIEYSILSYLSMLETIPKTRLKKLEESFKKHLEHLSGKTHSFSVFASGMDRITYSAQGSNSISYFDQFITIFIEIRNLENLFELDVRKKFHFKLFYKNEHSEMVLFGPPVFELKRLRIA